MQFWRVSEEAKLVALRKDGETHRAIAKLLGRSIPSVKDRAAKLRDRNGRFKGIRSRSLKLVSPSPVLTTIIKEDLPAFYELGWRVESFDARQCKLLWPHQTPPKMPVEKANAA